ncbi:MAG: hypothetical protein D6826_05570 [Alphaproteobacteria bacterium]|nr:MAG: hypothetical protein D6826_05570 [Alphaproteobacteria bacterium]
MQTLKILVIVMGGLIVVALALVAYGLVSRLSAPAGGPAFGDVMLDLPAGCRLAAAEARDGRLIVRADGPAERGCQQVVVIDLASGRVQGRVQLRTAP